MSGKIKENWKEKLKNSPEKVDFLAFGRKNSENRQKKGNKTSFSGAERGKMQLITGRSRRTAECK